MSILAGPVFLTGNDLYQNDTVQTQPIGTMAYGVGGKIFRYALVGGVSLVMGNLLQAAAQDTQFENMAIGTAAVSGQSTLQITNGSTTVVPAAFDQASISVYTAGTVAIGDEYTVAGPGAITGTLTTGGALTVALDRPTRAAFTTSAKVNMKKNPWSGVIQAPASTQTDIAVGVALFAATTATYSWVQTHGPAAVLSDGSTFAVGSEVGTPSGTAGAATVYAAGTTHMRVGYARMAAASAHAISVFLTID